MSPLDEVRTALAFFDETLFSVVPRLYRAGSTPRSIGAGRRAVRGDGRGDDRPDRDAAAAGRGRSCAGESWIGGDRDGNPAVTAEITERTLRIHADHVLRGYEAVATRLAQTIAAATPRDRLSAAARDRLARDAEVLPETRPPAPPALPRRAVPPAVRVHRRAAPPDAGRT